jgi:hypothetical protein
MDQQPYTDFDTINLQPNKSPGYPQIIFSETGQLWGNPLYKWYNTAAVNPDEENLPVVEEKDPSLTLTV